MAAGREVWLWRLLWILHSLAQVWQRNSNCEALRIELTHWASQNSPLAARYHSLQQRMQFAVQQSHARAQALQKSHARAQPPNTYKSLVSPFPFGGVFVMDLNVGNPPQSFQAVMDTGSDLVWLQTYPCLSCGRTIFYPSNSSSYNPLSCQSPLCHKLSNNSLCESSQSSCTYRINYGKGQTSGHLVTDTITMVTSLGSFQQFSGFALGNGYSNVYLEYIQGVVGLGQGPLSLTSQLSSAISNKFSYCLVDVKSSSFSSPLFFGDEATISSSFAKSTPIVPSSIFPSYYLVEVHFIHLNGRSFRHFGSTIIDSGTTLTYLEHYLYSSLRQEFVSLIPLPLAYSDSGLDLCYDTSSNPYYKFPLLTIEFNGATFSPPSSNYFASFDIDSNIICLAMASMASKKDGILSFNVIGNLLQQNFHFLYDRENSLISFAAANCTTL